MICSLSAVMLIGPTLDATAAMGRARHNPARNDFTGPLLMLCSLLPRLGNGDSSLQRLRRPNPRQSRDCRPVPIPVTYEVSISVVKDGSGEELRKCSPMKTGTGM